MGNESTCFHNLERHRGVGHNFSRQKKYFELSIQKRKVMESKAWGRLRVDIWVESGRVNHLLAKNRG